MKKNFTIRDSVPIAELESYMRKWESRAEGFVKVYSIGESGGWPILCAEFTDPSVPACEKEVALITAQHSGMEITGMTTVLSVGNYLAALDEKARRILHTQIVLLVPCPNCYSYAGQAPEYQFRNAAGADEYQGFGKNTLELVDPEKTPSCKALKELVDKWQPEFLFDNHGVWYNDQTLLEFTGGLSGCGLNRTFDRRFVDKVDDAAREEGFDIFSEDEAQTIFPVAPICFEPEYRKRFRGGADTMLLGPYAYTKYHTLALNSEVGFERSGFLRVLKALELGCDGYPVQKVVSYYGMGEPMFAAGANAAERRASRVELWPQNHRVGCGIIHPETPGLAGMLVTLSAEAHKRVCTEPWRTYLDPFCDNMEREGFDMADMRAALDGCYDVYVEGGAGADEPLSRTTAFRMGTRIPFADAQPTGVWLNGRRLAEGEYDLERRGQATHVSVVISPDAVEEVFFLVVKYDCEPKPMGILEF